MTFFYLIIAAPICLWPAVVVVLRTDSDQCVSERP